jgi:hypothetical protein
MELSEIKCVIEIDYTDQVNEYLQKGWEIIKIYTSSFDPDISQNDQRIHYVLGATKDIDYSKELQAIQNKKKAIQDFIYEN